MKDKRQAEPASAARALLDARASLERGAKEGIEALSFEDKLNLFEQSIRENERACEAVKIATLREALNRADSMMRLIYFRGSDTIWQQQGLPSKEHFKEVMNVVAVALRNTEGI